MHRIPRNRFVYAFRPDAEPVLTIEPGERIRIETYDASTGRIARAEDLPAYLAVRDPRAVNPAGGPIAVRGARSGDELIVTIERIGLPERGYIRAAPGGPVVPDVEGPRAVIVPIEGDVAVLPGGLRLPVRPMVGVIGTAPAAGIVYTADPGPQGSNLDCNAITVGARVHLPVNVAGGLLAIGDVHAAMGDGEVSGTGIEVNAEVDVRVEVGFCASRGRPWIESPTAYVTTGSAPGIAEAISIAVQEMVRLLGDRHSLDHTEAFMAISAAGDVHVGQCCGGLDATAYVAFPRPA